MQSTLLRNNPLFLGYKNTRFLKYAPLYYWDFSGPLLSSRQENNVLYSRWRLSSSSGADVPWNVFWAYNRTISAVPRARRGSGGRKSARRVRRGILAAGHGVGVPGAVARRRAAGGVWRPLWRRAEERDAVLMPARRNEPRVCVCRTARLVAWRGFTLTRRTRSGTRRCGTWWRRSPGPILTPTASCGPRNGSPPGNESVLTT